MLTNIKTKDKLKLVMSGNKGLRVVPKKGSRWYKHQWKWNGIMPLCLDDNTCRTFLSKKSSENLIQGGYPFSEYRSGKIVTQFTYKGKIYEHSHRTDSEGAIIYSTPGAAIDLPMRGLPEVNNDKAKLNKKETLPRRYRVLSFSEKTGFQDVKDFDPSLARTTRMNHDRHLETTAIHARLEIPYSADLNHA